MSQRVETWQLRVQFATRMYGAELPAYTTIIEAWRCTPAGDPSKPVVYEDFLPETTAGVYPPSTRTVEDDENGANSDHSHRWTAGQIRYHLHDPYELYEEAKI
ncbi:MAG TPA: hypothetical protein VHU62_19455 [Mycobacterium sp.]|nr:hypothetical protein [Mycobacterium sp.]